MATEPTAASGSSFALRDHVEAALEIAERIERGTVRWTDAPTLVCHLRVILEDYCDD